MISYHLGVSRASVQGLAGTTRPETCASVGRPIPSATAGTQDDPAEPAAATGGCAGGRWYALVTESR